MIDDCMQEHSFIRKDQRNPKKGRERERGGEKRVQGKRERERERGGGEKRVQGRTGKLMGG